MARSHRHAQLIALQAERPPFTDRPDLACKRPEFDPDLWHRRSEGATTKAQNICRTCPALHECASWAIETRQGHGVWGATTADDRERLTRQVTA